MKWGPFLQMLDTLVPNSIPPQTKADMLHTLITETYRSFPVDDTPYPFVTVPGVDMYPMPEDCDSESIQSVVINGVNYVYQGNTSQPTESRMFTFVSGIMFINPIPTVPGVGIMFYRSKPQPFDAHDAKADLPYNEDYAHLLLYGLGRLIALSKEKPDMQKVAFLQNEYLRIEQKGKKEVNKPRKKRVSVVRGFY